MHECVTQKSFTAIERTVLPSLKDLEIKLYAPQSEVVRVTAPGIDALDGCPH